MATKRKQRKNKAKKTHFRGFLILFALCVGSAIIFASSLYLSESTSTAPLPAYEETFPISSEFNKKIKEIDESLYKSLYERKVPEKDIFFLGITPKHERGNDWEFTHLLVELPGIQSLAKLDEIIERELSALGPAVSYRKERVTKHEVAYHISSLGFDTHEIHIKYRGYKEVPKKKLPMIAMIIDDLGYDRNFANAFFRLGLPLSFSILPLAPYTESIAREAQERGHELILHLPMEPTRFPSINPGPGALLTDMGGNEIRRTLIAHLKRIPGVRGVNNHMGSLFTTRRDKMAILFKELKRRNLFYIDSRTTTQTVAFDLAKKMGLPVANRTVFLDNDLSPKAIEFQMERLLGLARYSGKAIGIGHPHWETLKILKNYRYKLKNDFRVVPAANLVGK